MSGTWDRFNLTSRQRLWLAYKSDKLGISRSELMRRELDRVLESVHKDEIEKALAYKSPNET